MVRHLFSLFLDLLPELRLARGAAQGISVACGAGWIRTTGQRIMSLIRPDRWPPSSWTTSNLTSDFSAQECDVSQRFAVRRGANTEHITISLHKKPMTLSAYLFLTVFAGEEGRGASRSV